MTWCGEEKGFPFACCRSSLKMPGMRVMYAMWCSRDIAAVLVKIRVRIRKLVYESQREQEDVGRDIREERGVPSSYCSH